MRPRKTKGDVTFGVEDILPYPGEIKRIRLTRSCEAGSYDHESHFVAQVSNTDSPAIHVDFLNYEHANK